MSHTIFFPSTDAENLKLLEWAAVRIPHLTPSASMRAVGVVAGGDLTFPLLAVCIYHNYTAPKEIDGKTWYGTCEISFAAASPKWATRRSISTLLSIPFLQYACRKVVTATPSTNKRALRFNEGIGLKPEGTLRHQYAKNVHACICGMTRGEFEARWKNPRPKVRRPTEKQAYGQQERIGTPGP
jgi:RimJ/RimL family protein N-acetyltransferase